MRINSLPVPYIVTALALLGSAPVVRGQQQETPLVNDKADKATSNTATIPTVVVTGNAGTYDPRRDDTAAKIVVNTEELTKYGDSSIVDALKRVPGVSVFSTGRGADIRMRGLGNGYTQILVNGEPAPAGFSIESLNPAQVERIEVIRSAIAEYSTESVAGTINIVLKKIAKIAERQIQVGYGGDATERTPRAMFSISDRNGKLSYSLSANSRVTWFNRNPSIIDINDSISGATDQLTRSQEIGRFSFFNLIPRFTWTLNNGDTISSENLISYTKFQFGSDQQVNAILGPPPDYRQLDLRVKTKTASETSDLSWSSRRWQDTKVEVKVGIQASNGDNDSSRTIFNQLSASTANSQNFSTTQKVYRTSGKLTKKIADSHELTTGWEASRNSRNEDSQEINAVAGGFFAAPLSLNSNATLLRSAAFIQDDWTLSSNWSIYLGARVEHLTTDVRADSESHVSANIWSPIFQTLFKLPNYSNDQVRLALTRTFKAPELTSLIPLRHRNEQNSSTNPDVEGNASLRPEVANGIDITYEHYFNKTALFSIGASSRNIQDYTLMLIDQGTDGRWISTPVNAGSARTRGLELEAKFPLNLLSKNWPAVELRSSLSRNWSSVDQVPGPNNRVAQQVPFQSSFSADYSVGALTTGGSFTFRRGAWSNVTAAQSTFTITRRDLDLYALWKLKEKRQIRVTLGNLLKADDVTANRFASDQGTLTRTVKSSGYSSARVLFEQKF